MTLLSALLAILLISIIPLLYPLFRTNKNREYITNHEFEVFLEQLREHKIDKARGLIDDSQDFITRVEIEKRLLSSRRKIPEKIQKTDKNKYKILSVFLSMYIIIASLVLYLDAGSPSLPSKPFNQQKIVESDKNKVNQVYLRLATVKNRLSNEPHNPNVWRDLGLLRLSLGEDNSAIKALSMAFNLSDERPDIASIYAETLVYIAKGKVTPEAKIIFEKILIHNNDEPKAQYFLALDLYQRGMPKKALEKWQKIAAVLPNNSPWLPKIYDKIGQTSKELDVEIKSYLPIANMP